MIFWILILSTIIDPNAFAGQAFARQKVHVHGIPSENYLAGPIGKASADFPLLVLVNNDCLQRSGDRLAGLGITLKHKNSTHLGVEARAGRFDGDSQTLENILRNEPCVVGVTDNAPVKSQGIDPLFADQAFPLTIRQLGGERFFFHALWGIRVPVTVAAVDSGVQASHPDLAGRIWRAADGTNGYDFVNDDADPADDFGHGTHVAGLMAAQRDNDVGVRGIMGDWSKLMAVKSQDAFGGGTMADVVNALRWAVEHGAEVVNLSLSSRMQNQALVDALDEAVGKGVTVVVAAGNDGEEISAANFFSPVGYAPEFSGVIGVGSVDADSKLRSNFSNFGTSYVEISAPGAASNGVGLLSTYPGGRYSRIAGTSMSSPQVAGAAALVNGFLKTHGVGFTPAVVEQLILQSAENISANDTEFAGGRLLNLERLGRYLFNSTFVSGTGGFDD